jgi:hypothetical protein
MNSLCPPFFFPIFLVPNVLTGADCAAVALCRRGHGLFRPPPPQRIVWGAHLCPPTSPCGLRRTGRERFSLTLSSLGFPPPASGGSNSPFANLRGCHAVPNSRRWRKVEHMFYPPPRICWCRFDPPPAGDGRCEHAFVIPCFCPGIPRRVSPRRMTGSGRQTGKLPDAVMKTA